MHIKKQVSPLILIIAITVIIVSLLVAVETKASTSNLPKAVEGSIDLQSWELAVDGSISLQGTWGFYWQQLLTPAELRKSTNNGKNLAGATIQVPGVWGNQEINGVPLSNQGYGTYELSIRLQAEDVGETLALLMPSVATSYKLWLNGKLVESHGKVGTSREQMVPQNYTKPIYFISDQQDIEVLLQVSNFVQRKGGVWEGITLGTAEQITLEREKGIIGQVIIAGGLFIIGIYYIVLYLFRRSNVSVLFFGIASLLLMIRILLTGDVLLTRVWPEFDWELAVKMEYIMPAMGIGFLLLFAYYLYPQDLIKGITYALFVALCLINVPVLLFSALVFTQIITIYQALLVVSLLYILIGLIIAASRKRRGAWGNLVVIAIFFVAVIHETFYYNYLIERSGLIPAGVLIFALALILAARFSSDFSQMERMSKQLQETNQLLEEKVEQRTKELKEMSIRDSLTNVLNRGGFEEFMQSEWVHAKRTGSPLSILLLDIDEFKSYNDTYGHQAGDDCLKRVAKAFQESVRESDVVGRYGGEEFAIILPRTDKAGANAVAEKIRSSIEELKIAHKSSKVSSYLTVSIGGATTFPKVNDYTIEQFIYDTDCALYQAKRKGRNQVVMHGNV